MKSRHLSIALNNVFRLLKSFVLLTVLASASIAQNPPTPRVDAVVNAATFAPGAPVAPGVIFSIFGDFLTFGDYTAATSIPLPTRLGTATVLVDGVAAPLFYASPGQINAQFPVELSGATTAQIQVRVENANGAATSSPLTVAVRPFSPGIFTLNQNGAGPGVILRADFSLVCPQGRSDCSPNFAAPGEAISIYMTGLGQVNGPWVSGRASSQGLPTLTTPVVRIGGVRAQVLYSGTTPGLVGLYQVNVMVPSVIPASTAIPLSLTIGDRFANTVNLATGAASPLEIEIPRGGNPPAGDIQAIAVDPTNSTTLFAGTDGMGIFKSTDAGATWQAANLGLASGFIRSIVVDPRAPSTVYAGTQFAALFKSVDGGASWKDASNGIYGHGVTNPTVTEILVDPSEPSTLYVGASEMGIGKSTNGGATWVALGPTRATRPLFLDPQNPSTIYALDSQGLRKSFDGGGTWSVFNARVRFNGQFFPVTPLAIDPTAPSTLYGRALANSEGRNILAKSTDFGVNWSLASDGLPNAQVHAIAVSPSNSSMLYAVTSSGVFKSANGAVNWVVASAGLPSALGPAITFDPTTSSTLYVGGAGGGVFKTTDAAAVWTHVSNGLTNASVRALVTDPGGSTTLYAGTPGGGVFKTVDRGAHWSAVNMGLADTHVNALEIDRFNRATIYAGTNTGVFRSTDGGTSWIPINSGFQGIPTIDVIATDPSSPAIVYAGTFGSGLYKSNSGGATWTQASEGITDSHISALAIHPTVPTTLYAGTLEAGVFKSVNGGLTWNAVNSGLETFASVRALALDSNNPSTLYAAIAGQGVYKTTDGGVTWQPANNGLTEDVWALAIDRRNSATLYAATSPSGIFKSVNGGATWNMSSTVISNLWLATTNSYRDRFINGIVIDPSDSSVLYAGTESQGIYKSTNGGETWIPLGAE
jgi:uncharacterized protein (TIGR03437 family)